TERARRKERRRAIRALAPSERAAALSADKKAKKEAKKTRKLAVRAMAKPDRRTAKRHDKLFQRIWNRPRRIVIWAVVLCLLAFGIYSAAPYIGDYASLMGLKIDSNNAAGEAARANGAIVAEEISDEGIVLLKNTDGLLPLTNGKVNVFSYAAYNIRYGGSGSGGADASSAVDLFEGLTNAGVSYNETLDAFYRAQKGISQKGSSNGLISVLSTMLIGEVTDEPAIDYLTDDVLAQAKSYSDTAIVVIGSDGVEASDFTLDALGLTKNRIDLFDKVCAAFDTVIVVVNAGNSMELGFLEQYPSIKAALWIGTPGPFGCDSLGKILAGEVNPSGRLVDTYAYDAGSSPASVNFGDYQYDNIDGMSFLNYNEGIYVGYRYYETRYLGDEAGYRAAVQFPFGYGLSYTTFDWETTDFTSDDTAVSVSVQVKNTGSVAGKDVVEVYFTAPYTPGGTEKSAIELAGYAKTNLLAPGESQTVSICFPLRDMSSYDMNDQQAYVLDAGEYAVKIGRSVHDIVDTQMLSVPETIVYKTDDVTGTELSNLFGYADGGLTYLSRSDWTGSYPNNDTLSHTASQAVLDGAAAQKPAADTTSAMPTTGADNGILLKDLKGLDYDDEKWQLFLDQFTVDELKEVFVNAAYRTVAVERVGLPQIILLDGPAGINALFSKVTAMSYPTEVVIASTWNDDLTYRMGEAVGAEANAYGVTGWYAPGMNLHRTPQGGRNFEYFSEDPLLSGKIAANMVSGAESKHILVTMKHFALNEQETNARSGIYVWANEQAIRELYLRPFEITVKEGHVNGAMSSFIHIGYKWSGGNPELLNQVLRNEWGFTGFVTTDAVLGKFMDANLALHNGNDLMLTVMPTNNRRYLNELYAEDPVGVTKGLRERVHNFCYALVNDTDLF
ncbi:MAG TPA: glycoside hydrolase family 3 N-terminal domain-containing protein, partial [Feifaniaceae bacterium]|nr:glycoside hydrolase family 3 N-terminal domain-containing protein [Feifaniaceae bacterium]